MDRLKGKVAVVIGAGQTRMARRMRSGVSKRICCAMKPPREKPIKSTGLRSSARIVAIVSSAIWATTSGASPSEVPMPR